MLPSWYFLKLRILLLIWPTICRNKDGMLWGVCASWAEGLPQNIKTYNPSSKPYDKTPWRPCWAKCWRPCWNASNQAWDEATRARQWYCRYQSRWETYNCCGAELLRLPKIHSRQVNVSYQSCQYTSQCQVPPKSKVPCAVMNLHAEVSLLFARYLPLLFTLKLFLQIAFNEAEFEGELLAYWLRREQISQIGAPCISIWRICF